MLEFDNASPNSSPQTMENPYIIVPENNEVNQLSIKKGGFIVFLLLFLLIISLSLPVVFLVNTTQLYCIIAIIIIIILILIILLICKSRIVLIKDKENNRLTVQEKNYFCCNIKTYNIPFEHCDIKAEYDRESTTPPCFSNYSIIIVINADPNVTDIDNNNIKNIPFKFIKRFPNLIGIAQELELSLVNFIGCKFNNTIEEEIKLHVPNYKGKPNISLPFNCTFSSESDNFLKISDHFYMFYNYNYLGKKSGNESFQRLDWIYTNDFDRIFIGVVKNDTRYVNTFIYTIESIDKFILEIRDGKLCLKIILNDGFNTEICRYTREKDNDVNTFIYLINGQINKIKHGNNGNEINNENNQDYPEKPEEPDNSAPTLM